jgi:hypothetical protein
MALAPAARADGEGRAAAVAAFEDAERTMASGQVAAACPKYAESYRLDPQLGALLHLADCYEKAGRIASAWAAFQEGKELAQTRRDPRASVAEQRVKELEPRLCRLSIIVPESARVQGLEIRRDGIVVGEALWGSAVPVDPGKHVLEASAPGRKPWKGTVQVTGEGRTETFTLVPLETFTMVNLGDGSEANASDSTSSVRPAAGGNAALTADSSVTGDRGATQRLLGWSAVGAGVIGVGAGVVFQLKRSSKLSDRDAVCPTGRDCSAGEIARIDQLTDEARSASTISAVSFVAGGVLAAGGVALVLTAPKSQRTALSAQPMVARGMFGAGVTGRF